MNGIPAIPSGLSTADLITAINDRLRRVQTALNSAAATPASTVTVVQQTTVSPSTGAPVADTGYIDSVTGVDTSSLASNSPLHQPHWVDPGAALHTVLGVTVTVTTNEASSQLVTLWLNQGNGPLWLGWFAAAGVVTYLIGTQGSPFTNIWTPIGTNQQWSITAAFGAIGNGAAVPAGAVTSPPFTVYCRSGSYAQVQNPVSGLYTNALIAAQSVLANGNNGGSALLTLTDTSDGVAGQLLLTADNGNGISLLHQVLPGAVSLPASPLGFLLLVVTSPNIGGTLTIKVPFYGYGE